MPATLRSLTLTALTVVCLSLLFTSVAIAELQYDRSLMRNPPILEYGIDKAIVERFFEK